jgi:hypothetical protein
MQFFSCWAKTKNNPITLLLSSLFLNNLPSNPSLSSPGQIYYYCGRESIEHKSYTCSSIPP